VRAGNGHKPGRGGLKEARDGADRAGGRGGVAWIQRARMITAMAELARENGVGQVTVAHIVSRSGVSRRTFYELFEDREACFIAAMDEAVQRAAGRVLPAYRAAGSWRERIGAGLGALLEFLDDEPGLGALCVVDALGAGPEALQCRALVVGKLIDAVDEGREECKASLRPTRLTAEGAVGAVLAVLHARLAGADSQPMVELLGPLMGMILLPYRGSAAAGRELARPRARRPRASPRRGDPLRDLDMRLTYRTVRVLTAIAAHPGASNRLIADTSGVVDQGQISKLLSRLEHLELINNSSAGYPRGEPNAWCLTPRGEEVEQTIRRETPAIAN
jgi:AcrR family transcriptional regulator/DNA-binding MarR family transcriptional regulator